MAMFVALTATIETAAAIQDRLVLSYDCEVSGVLLKLVFREGEDTKEHLRRQVVSIELRGSGADQLVLAGNIKREGEIVSVTLKSPFGVVTFLRNELTRIRLGIIDPEAAKKPNESEVTAEQKRWLDKNNELYREHVRKLSVETHEKRGRISADHGARLRETQKVMEAARKSVRVKEKNNHTIRFTLYGKVVAEHNPLAEAHAKLRAAEAREAELTKAKAFALSELSIEEKQRREKLASVFMKHKSVILAKGKLSEAVLANNFLAATE
ncbi:MAG: hypothetical protein QUV05_15335 [Phycisphaerae bacterium]|nr:hypothetical protein [Phycisphaerae bacterium]